MSNVMDKARGRVMLFFPFFGYAMLSATFVAVENNPQLDTAATDGEKVYYNPAFINGLDILVAVFVIVHEICHVIFDHAGRRGSRNHERWNWACDYAINIMLKDFGLTLWKECLVDEKYRGWSPERIYDDLERTGRTPPPGKPMLGDLMPSHRTPEQQEQVSKRAREIVSQARVMASAVGTLPKSLDIAIGEVIDPGVPWYELLRDKMTLSAKLDDNWSRPNRRYSGFHLPTLDGERLGEFIAIIDTSGSFTAEDYRKAAGAINAAAEAVKPSLIRVIYADTKVQREEIFEEGDELIFRPKGGGGTDMRVPLSHVEQYGPAFVVLFTDAATPWPDCEPPYPLIVICSSDAPVPIGEVIRV